MTRPGSVLCTLAVLVASALASARHGTEADRSATPAATAAGRAGAESSPSPVAVVRPGNIPYNGRFTFTRIRYNSRGGGYRRRGWSNAWNHDYPNADLNMQLMLSEFTAMHPNLGDSNVLDLEDPEIFRHPILYMSEPGYWSITDEGAANLREHIAPSAARADVIVRKADDHSIAEVQVVTRAR